MKWKNNISKKVLRYITIKIKAEINDIEKKKTEELDKLKTGSL